MTTKKQVTPSGFDNMASQLEHWAGRYRELGERLKSKGIDGVGVTGMATFERIIDHLASNTRRIGVQIQKAIDDQSQGKRDDS
jgi:flagellar biosynthesis chaperone FliJ